MPEAEQNVMDEVVRTEETQDQHEITETPEAETPETTQESETENEVQEKKGGNGFSKKIGKLTARNHILENMNAQLQERLEAIERRLGGNEAPAKAASSDRPTADKFGTWEEYEEALVDWKTEQKFKEREEASRKQTAKERSEQALQSYTDRAHEFAEDHEDFFEVIGKKDAYVPESAQVAIVKLENGPAVAYYIAQNPNVVKELWDMRDEPELVIMKIARIADSLESKSSPATRPRSGAPAPYKPVGTSSTKSTMSLEDMPQRQYNELMNKRERERSGR